MTHFKLAWSNLKFILANSDALAIRVTLAFGSLMWAVWALLASLPYPIFEKLDDSFPDKNLWLWGCLFALHSASLFFTVLLRWKDQVVDAATGMLGVILWTGSLLLILAARLHEGSLPMGGAHWACMFMSWWVFAKVLAQGRRTRK
jgi:hypothetical protein